MACGNKRKQLDDRMRTGSNRCPQCPVHGGQVTRYDDSPTSAAGQQNANGYPTYAHSAYCNQYRQQQLHDRGNNYRYDDDDDDCCGVKEPCSCCERVPDCCPSKCPVPDCCPCPPPIPKAIYPPCCPMPPKCGGTCPTPNPCPCKGCVAPDPPPPCPTPTPPNVPIPPCGCVPFIKPRPCCCCPPCCIPEPCAPPPPPPLCPPPKLCDCDRRGTFYDDVAPPAPSTSNQGASVRRSTGGYQMDLDSMVGQAACPDCCRAACPNCVPPPPCRIPCECMPAPCCDADFSVQWENGGSANKRARMDCDSAGNHQHHRCCQQQQPHQCRFHRQQQQQQHHY